MLFGFTNAHTTFEALMNEVLKPFLCHFVLVFFDDILIYNSSSMKHLWHVPLVLTMLQEHQMFLKRSKCAFGMREVAYICHIISKEGVAMDKQKVCAVLDWPVPSSMCAVCAFLELVGYYHRFIREYGSIVAPLTRLLHKEDVKWCAEAKATFLALY
jgi:hypothetical protein